MAVQIIPKNDGYSVNGKSIYKNMDGLWESKMELSYTEKKYFREYLKIKELTTAPIVEATFKI